MSLKSKVEQHVDVSAKIRENIMCVEKNIVEIPVHVVVKMVNI